ncbi:hypothetical protein BH20CHL2_BH20CHL2_08140 [soil metagenome]
MSSSRTLSAHPTSRLRRRLIERRSRELQQYASNAAALVPVVNAGDDVGPTLERRLAPTVQRAHLGDKDACAALFLAFRPKLIRFIRRIPTPRTRPDQVGLWDREDVEQEAWIVFDELIAQWSPERPFGRYVLANFPWRLRDAVYRGVARRGVPPRMTLVPISDHDWLHDGSAAGDEARALLNAVAERLPDIQGVILRRHIGDGEALSVIARDLGVSRRTVTRPWRIVRDHLAEDISSAPPTRRMA